MKKILIFSFLFLSLLKIAYGEAGERSLSDLEKELARIKKDYQNIAQEREKLGGEIIFLQSRVREGKGKLRGKMNFLRAMAVRKHLQRDLGLLRINIIKMRMLDKMEIALLFELENLLEESGSLKEEDIEAFREEVNKEIDLILDRWWDSP